MATAREDLERIGLLKIGDIAGRRSEGEEAGTDRRILKTRRAIRDALISILEEKEIGSITIKEIAERASVNRKTFYAHYASIAELICKIAVSIVLSRLIGATGIWFAAPIGWILGGLIVIVVFYRGKWEKRLPAGHESAPSD